MTTRSHALWIQLCGWSVLALLLLCAPSASAAPQLNKTVRLRAQGGVTTSVPAWKVIKEGPDVVVLEQGADPGADIPYQMLMVVIEPGPALPKPNPARSPTAPAAPTEIDWQAIADTLIAGASVNGRTMTLHLDGPFDSGQAKVKAVRMVGTFKDKDGQQVAINLITLVYLGDGDGDGALVTVSVASDTLSVSDRGLVDAVATALRR